MCSSRSGVTTLRRLLRTAPVSHEENRLPPPPFVPSPRRFARCARSRLRRGQRLRRRRAPANVPAPTAAPGAARRRGVGSGARESRRPMRRAGVGGTRCRSERGRDPHRRRRPPPHAARPGRAPGPVSRGLHDRVLLVVVASAAPTFRVAIPRARRTRSRRQHGPHRRAPDAVDAGPQWLEPYLATSALANSNPANRPGAAPGARRQHARRQGARALSKVLHVGGAFELWLVNGTGAVGLDGGGTSAKFRALGDGRPARRGEAHPSPVQPQHSPTSSTTRAGGRVDGGGPRYADHAHRALRAQHQPGRSLRHPRSVPSSLRQRRRSGRSSSTRC